jgi:hypothetical protein
VREPGPFTLDVAEREITAAVGAKLEVKVRTKRQWPDFKAAVAVTPLAGPMQNGKAITIPNVNIAANQGETTVKFQLPSNTAPGTYSLVFQGKGKVSLQRDSKDKKKTNADFYAVTPPIKLTVFNTVVELALDKPSIALKPDSTGAVSVKVKRLHKYNGPIQVELVPQANSQGIKAASLTLASGKDEGQLLIQVPKNAKPAVYPNFLIRASAKFDGTVLKEETTLKVAINNNITKDGAVFDIKTTPLLPENTVGWKYLPAKAVTAKDWQTPTFDDKGWMTGNTPFGYGEEEIQKRKGTTVAAMGQPVCFRHELNVPAELLAKKGVSFRLMVASDDSATVYVNGQVVDKDDVDHEFSYWNRDVAIPANLLRPGRNVVAVLVDNGAGSSDLYLDLAIHAQVAITKTPTKK